ncbi:MAG TPA: 3-hydroxyacyl-ACP dehydratase FabZ [Pseudolabrys sp.]|nr:3-hydroxyacyl-ACP dehydratase FabZ [Pseudolabrys sp.]
MNEIVKELDSVGISKVLKLLPHRYPFIMVDRVIDIDGNKSGIGIKNVTINEPQFQGHFPENPVFPGVLLIEGMAQTGGILCLIGMGASTARPVYFMTIDEAKFRRPVVPGDTVEFHMSLLAQRRNMWWYRGEAKVKKHVVAEAKVGAMLLDPEPQA